MGFIDTIKARAKADKKVIVLPETEDRRTYEATAQILKEGIADVVLVGSEEAIKKGSEGLDISGAKIVDPATSEKTQGYIYPGSFSLDRIGSAVYHPVWDQYADAPLSG